MPFVRSQQCCKHQRFLHTKPVVKASVELCGTPKGLCPGTKRNGIPKRSLSPPPPQPMSCPDETKRYTGTGTGTGLQSSETTRRRRDLIQMCVGVCCVCSSYLLRSAGPRNHDRGKSALFDLVPHLNPLLLQSLHVCPPQCATQCDSSHWIACSSQLQPSFDIIISNLGPNRTEQNRTEL